MINHHRLLTSILLATVNSCAIAYGADYLQEGIARFKAQEYYAARAAFARAVDQEPNSDIAHYYLANSLAKTHRLSEAVREYKCALSLSKDAALKSYCNLALSRAELAMASAPPPSSPPPNLDSQHITKALSDIQQQSTSRITQSSSDLKAAEQALLDIQQRAKKMRTDANDKATAMKNEIIPVETRGGSILVPKYSWEEIEDVRTAAYQKAANFEQLETSAANERLLSAQRRQQALADVAESLESQLQATSAGKSSVHLLPQGTNLYVRNYLEEPGKVIPLIAYPLLLPDPSAGTGLHAGSASKLHVHPVQTQATKIVHAKLITP